jgi:ubiquinone/menaquinone biosynthesis C-methylase UbiE
VLNHILALKKQIAAIAEETSPNDWYQSLDSRKLAELEFHNRDRDENLKESLSDQEKKKFYGNKKYYTTTQLSTDYVDSWLRKRCEGKVVLDYACGNGERSRFIAKEANAALTVGIDISDVSITNARKIAEDDSLSDRVLFIQADCENTKLPDATFDVIYCSGMLHHLDLSYAFPEMRRILKPGGHILAVESLAYNPLIKLYRLITPAMRTEWEKNHILSLADVTFARRFFSIGEVNFWHITSIFAGPLAKFPSLQKFSLGVLNAVDKIVTKIPLVRRMAWQFTFEMIKPAPPKEPGELAAK